MCGGIFEKGLTDEEAIAEAESKGLNVSDCDLVCDDCYKKTPWGKAKQWKMK
jgi:epoxyqueuosine reductase QueG